MRQPLVASTLEREGPALFTISPVKKMGSGLSGETFKNSGWSFTMRSADQLGARLQLLIKIFAKRGGKLGPYCRV